MNAVTLAAHKLRGLYRLLAEVRNWPTWLSCYFGKRRNDKTPVDFHFRNGATLHGSRNASDVHLVAEIWLYRRYNRHDFGVKPGEIVVDLGGNVGVFAVHAGVVGEAKKVVSFEAHPDNFAFLKRNAETNNRRFNRDAIVPVHQAVWEHDRGITLHDDPENPGGHSVVLGSGRAIQIPSTTLSAIFDQYQLPGCDLLKVDIEGAEYAVFESSRDALKRVGRIVMEHHKTETRDVGDAKKLLEEIGFDVFVEDNFLFARNKNRVMK